jgi:hydroxyethylthiazole kinase-like uncharacterized protein yjeF
LSSSDLPTLTSAQVKELDRLAAERFSVPVDWLMEAAGWTVARFCTGPTAVVCGVGNNAGDGLAAARHLHRAGRLVAVCCADTARLKGPAAAELEALRRLGVEVSSGMDLGDATLIADAIFGTGLSRAPEGRFAEWIEAINNAGKRVVAVDIPSGLDADSGVAYSPCVRADLTVTLGLPKAGMMTGDGPALCGEVWVADLGIPAEAYAELGIHVPQWVFGQLSAIRL